LFVHKTLAALVLILLFITSGSVVAQSPDGSITGIVLDPDTKSIVGAEIIAVNDLTGLKYVTLTNGDGIYSLQNLPPGPYRIQVSKVGFKAIIKPDIVLNVQDALSVNFKLPIGASSVTVTVEGGAPMLNTTDGSLSTIVDRNFVENMPLNGRSFQDLILLTPGVLTSTPQVNYSTLGQNGEFSVNGQRTESNYYTVDGVSANVGVSPGYSRGPANSGSLPAASALGTTQALVSVDALQEFRVQSSTYAAEFGRNPGGQFAFVTRAGTNQWHGTAFDYLRNGVLDATDWFNGYYGLKQPAVRQNDFGGTLGGPATVRGLYSGKDRTFFFLSYEGLRLAEPQEANVSYVPTTDLRAAAPAALQPVLDAFPLPYCPQKAENCTIDLGNGLGDFLGSWSNLGSIDSYSIRLDHALSQRLKLFFRFSDVPSSVLSRAGSAAATAPSFRSVTSFETRTYTVGATSSLGSNVSNDFRVNFATNGSDTSNAPDGFGGAKAVNLIRLEGLNTAAYPYGSFAGCFIFSNAVSCAEQGSTPAKQEQWNVVDTVGVTRGRHQLKVGVDYRRLAPQISPVTPADNYYFFSQNSVRANLVDSGFASSSASAHPLYTNFSAFGQDQWAVTPRVSASLGLRWEVNPSPGAGKGNLPYTIAGDVEKPGAVTLRPQGTPLWNTTWYNFAPRVAMAIVVRKGPKFESVVRGGFGIFYDTGQQGGSEGYQGPGFSSVVSFSGPFPVATLQAAPAIQNPPAAPYGTVYAFPSDLQLPLTLQWNVTFSQALGQSQALTVSYVGANGRRLLEQSESNISSANPSFSYIALLKNGLTSSYNAAQFQFQRKLGSGLQVLASYTWSHSIDFGSFNLALPYQRASSDLDVRSTFSSALSYSIPNLTENRIARAVLRHWGFDDRFSARTGFPVTLNGNFIIDPATHQGTYGGLKLIPGQPLYVYGAQCTALFNNGDATGPGCPAGRAINPNAFVPPSSGQLGDAPRNLVRGFGAWQMDLAVRREFPLHETLKLQFRAEAFNISNHPNFGTINSTYCRPGPGCTFGRATATLAQSLGALNPLYQAGGPRSLQLSLKLMF
jgi:hypothetical protein